LTHLLRLSSFCLRATRRVLRAVSQLGMGLQALHDGFWLGVLTDEEHLRLTEQLYAGRTQWTHDGQNRSGLAPVEELSVRRYVPAGARILVAGAGGGREVLALSRMGYDVSGFDCNRALVDYGNRFLEREGCDVRMTIAPANHFPPPAGEVDAVIVGWGVYIHIPTRGLRLAFLTEARDCLGPHGVVVLGFCARDPQSAFYRTVAAIANTIRGVMGRERVPIGVKLEPTLETHATPQEIAKEATESGFEVLYVEAHDRSRAILVARRQT
jgi:2-polyprenyl-3-methyl-5-hydroxy-6-metoxy-1,4-benzoquinol methylase